MAHSSRRVVSDLQICAEERRATQPLIHIVMANDQMQENPTLKNVFVMTYAFYENDICSENKFNNNIKAA